MTIKQLLKKPDSQEGLLVSLYLPIRPGESKKEIASSTHSYLNKLKMESRNLKHTEEKYVNQIFSKIENFIEATSNQKTKTLAIFAGRDFFHTFRLPVLLPFNAHLGKTLHINPLTTAIETNPPYLIVVVDRSGAKIIEVNMTQEQQKSNYIESDVPQKILAKGDDMGRESKILRHIEEHLHRHIGNTVAVLKRFEEKYPFDLIVLAAHKELVGKFYRALPETISKKLAGTFPAKVNDRESIIIKRAQIIVDNFVTASILEKA